MRYIIFIITILTFTGCRKSKPISIQQFFPFPKMSDTTHTDKGIKTWKDVYFLISNYKDDVSTVLYLDSFVNKSILKERRSYNTYRMYFYKESDRTNLNKITENPREIDRYSNSHDLVFEYSWEDNKFKGREKIKEGEIIEPIQKKLKFTMELLPNDSL